MASKRLRAMGYPRHQEFTLEEKELQVAVCWLEEQKIRLYPVDGEERAQLRTFEKDWFNCFKKYLDDLQSPGFFGGEGNEGVAKAFEWLSSYALQLDYSDSKGKYNRKTAKVFDFQVNGQDKTEMEGKISHLYTHEILSFSHSTLSQPTPKQSNKTIHSFLFKQNLEILFLRLLPQTNQTLLPHSPSHFYPSPPSTPSQQK